MDHQPGTDPGTALWSTSLSGLVMNPALGVVGADIFGNCLGIGELLAQAFKHQGLDSRGAKPAAVGADTALAECRALHVVGLPLPLRADR